MNGRQQEREEMEGDETEALCFFFLLLSYVRKIERKISCSSSSSSADAKEREIGETRVGVEKEKYFVCFLRQWKKKSWLAFPKLVLGVNPLRNGLWKEKKQ